MAISFTKIHIGLNIEGVTAEHLVNYFSVEREESLTLEFKSHYEDSKLNFDGILRTVAAFLNSEGGLLIFGAPKDIAVRNNYRVVRGDLTPIQAGLTSKDALINKISDTISYMPVGIRIETIQFQDNTFVYLIEVQESQNKPHQYNKSYPIRLDGQSKPAPHYLVEALFKQVKVPELKGYLRVTSYRFDTDPSRFDRNTICLSFHVRIYNQTKTINDTGVYVQIIASAGRFVPNEVENYLFNGGVVFVKDASPVITYALATSCTFNYEIDSNEYTDFFHSEKELEIVIVFGSHKSITRQSSYFISFNNVSLYDAMNITHTRTRELNSLLSIRKEENVSVNDVWQGNEEDRHQITLPGI